jgi:hypothetical protein
MDSELRAGVAVYNAGHYHAAHDAWEERWLDLPEGDDDERFLHGLIQFTAAVYHARERNWSGTTGLAESGGDYLADLSPDYRGVNVETVRDYLAALRRDPEHIERASPPALAFGGDALGLTDLDFDATAIAAEVLAEDLGYDEGVVEQAVRYARADLADGDEGSQFVTFLLDFVREPEHRGIVVQRLSEHVDRRDHRESDIDGLFDER